MPVTVPVLDQALHQARALAAKAPATKTKGTDERTGEAYEAVTAKDRIKHGRPLLAQFYLSLDASAERLEGGCLYVTHRLASTLYDVSRDVTTVASLDTGVEPWRAILWARTFALAAAIKALLPDPEEEDVPLPKPSRCASQVEPANGNGSHDAPSQAPDEDLLPPKVKKGTRVWSMSEILRAIREGSASRNEEAATDDQRVGELRHFRARWTCAIEGREHSRSYLAWRTKNTAPRENALHIRRWVQTWEWPGHPAKGPDDEDAFCGVHGDAPCECPSMFEVMNPPATSLEEALELEDGDQLPDLGPVMDPLPPVNGNGSAVETLTNPSVRRDIATSGVSDPGRCECGHGHGFSRCPNTGGIAARCHVLRCDCIGFRPVARPSSPVKAEVQTPAEATPTEVDATEGAPSNGAASSRGMVLETSPAPVDGATPSGPTNMLQRGESPTLAATAGASGEARSGSVSSAPGDDRAGPTPTAGSGTLPPPAAPLEPPLNGTTGAGSFPDHHSPALTPVVPLKTLDPWRPQEIDVPCALCGEAIESGDRYRESPTGVELAHSACVTDLADGRDPRDRQMAHGPDPDDDGLGFGVAFVTPHEEQGKGPALDWPGRPMDEGQTHYAGDGCCPPDADMACAGCGEIARDCAKGDNTCGTCGSNDWIARGSPLHPGAKSSGGTLEMTYPDGSVARIEVPPAAAKRMEIRLASRDDEAGRKDRAAKWKARALTNRAYGSPGSCAECGEEIRDMRAFYRGVPKPETVDMETRLSRQGKPYGVAHEECVKRMAEGKSPVEHKPARAAVDAGKGAGS